MPSIDEHQQEVKTAKFDTECVIKLQKFEWLLVYHHKGSLPRATPTAWTSAYDSTGFARAERRLFGKANYEYYFGTGKFQDYVIHFWSFHQNFYHLLLHE
jgi:hypothetical protein